MTIFSHQPQLGQALLRLRGQRPDDRHLAAAMFSLISSAKRHHVEPLAYLTDLFTCLPSAPMSQLPDFLPDRWCHPAIEKSPPEQREEG